MPVLFSYIGLTDQEYMKRKKEKLGRKKRNGDKTPNFKSEKNFESLTIDAEDDKYSN